MEEQDGQNRPLLQPAEGKRAAVLEHLERPENPKLHKRVFTASQLTLKARAGWSAATA
jgi:hypothetical protein